MLQALASLLDDIRAQGTWAVRGPDKGILFTSGIPLLLGCGLDVERNPHLIVEDWNKVCEALLNVQAMNISWTSVVTSNCGRYEWPRNKCEQAGVGILYPTCPSGR